MTTQSPAARDYEALMVLVARSPAFDRQKCRIIPANLTREEAFKLGITIGDSLACWQAMTPAERLDATQRNNGDEPHVAISTVLMAACRRLDADDRRRAAAGN